MLASKRSWKCPFPFVDVHFYNKICPVLKGQMPGLGQMWDPVMIFTCQIVSNPRLRPRGGGSHVTMIGALGRSFQYFRMDTRTYMDTSKSDAECVAAF